MRSNVISGILLIIGSLAGVLVMLLHPTGRDLLGSGTPAHGAHLNMLVHGAALASVPILFLGLLGLHRRLESPDLSTAALVTWGVAAVAVMSAAVMSGFVATDVIGNIRELDGSAADMQHALLGYTGSVNQGFAKVNVTAAAVAILLWSIAIVRGRALPRGVGTFGIVVGSVILLGMFSGHLRLDVHGFGMVMFLQAAWMTWIGTWLIRARSEEPFG